MAPSRIVLLDIQQISLPRLKAIIRVIILHLEFFFYQFLYRQASLLSKSLIGQIEALWQGMRIAKATFLRK